MSSQSDIQPYVKILINLLKQRLALAPLQEPQGFCPFIKFFDEDNQGIGEAFKLSIGSDASSKVLSEYLKFYTVTLLRAPPAIREQDVLQYLDWHIYLHVNSPSSPRPISCRDLQDPNGHCATLDDLAGDDGKLEIAARLVFGRIGSLDPLPLQLYPTALSCLNGGYIPAVEHYVVGHTQLPDIDPTNLKSDRAVGFAMIKHVKQTPQSPAKNSLIEACGVHFGSFYIGEGEPYREIPLDVKDARIIWPPTVDDLANQAQRLNNYRLPTLPFKTMKTLPNQKQRPDHKNKQKVSVKVRFVDRTQGRRSQADCHLGWVHHSPKPLAFPDAVAHDLEEHLTDDTKPTYNPRLATAPLKGQWSLELWVLPQLPLPQKLFWWSELATGYSKYGTDKLGNEGHKGCLVDFMTQGKWGQERTATVGNPMVYIEAHVVMKDAI